MNAIWYSFVSFVIFVVKFPARSRLRSDVFFRVS